MIWSLFFLPFCLCNLSIFTSLVERPGKGPLYFVVQPNFNEQRYAAARFVSHVKKWIQNISSFLLIYSSKNLEYEWEKVFTPGFFSSFDEVVAFRNKISTIKYSSLLNIQKALSRTSGISEISEVCSGKYGEYPVSLVYISNKPVKEALYVPLEEPKSHKDFIRIYGHIVMAMTSIEESDPGAIVYENRGINKFPLAFFDKDYSNLSISLHSFSCAYFAKYKPHLEYMYVFPMENMNAILIKSLSPIDSAKPKVLFNGNVAFLLENEYDSSSVDLENLPPKAVKVSWRRRFVGWEPLSVFSVSFLASQFQGSTFLRMEVDDPEPELNIAPIRKARQVYDPNSLD